MFATNDLAKRDSDPDDTGTLTQRIYALTDTNGSVTALVDTSGTVVERFVYNPYGSATVLNGSWSSATDAYNWIYMFQGGRYNANNNLYLFDHRDYDPTTGTWLEQDPAGYVDGANRYQAFEDNPLANTDPTGLSAMDSNAIQNNEIALLQKLQSGNYSSQDLDELEGAMELLGVNQANIDQLIQPARNGLKQQTSQNSPGNLTGVIEGAVALDLAGGGPEEPLGDIAAAAFIAKETLAGEGAAAAENGESSFLQNYLNGSGGRWGSTETRAFNDQVATQFEDQGLDVINGAGRDSEEWIPGPNGGTAGGTWVDLTAQAEDGSITRVQTIDTLANGVTPTAHEAAAAARIQANFPDDQLILIPKPK